MQNIDVRFNATSNFGKVKADLTALEAQAASLRNVFASGAYAKPPELVNTDKWRAASRAVHEASNVYRAAASSSGLLTTQQIRATSEAERYTRALQKQKLSLTQMRKHSGIMKQVYADQLRMQRMTAQYWGTDMAGRAITDISIPKNVPRDLDTAAQKVYFLGQRANSAGTQIVNMGKNLQWAGRQLTVGFTYPVALFGAAAGVMAYKVDEAMTQITKVYDVSAAAMRDEAVRTKELNDVRTRSYEIAEQSAKKYGQSIEDTLGVEAALASTGLSGDKLFESTDAVSRIAALGDLDLTQSTEMTIALQTAFKDTIKTTDDLANTFNFMNAVENATSLTIKDIAEATPRAASSMSALGVTVQEMTVLLTSMKEAGVNAAEGANALKSATGTILSPSPAAIKFIETIAGPKIAQSMANIRDTTDGNLYQAIKQIYDMTRELSASDRQAIITKMFGKYQFNRISGMVTNLGQAFDYMGGDAEVSMNQAARAMKEMETSTAELSKRAEDELATKMEAVSGRFNAAWQTVRIELAKLGVPFLELATKAAELTGKVLEFFNSMSDWKKKAVLGVAAIMALAGPVVMLGGLFMNLGGQFLSGSGRIMSAIGRLGGAFGLITKEEQAATLSAEAQNTAMQKQGSTTSTLAQEVNVLTAAYEKATVAARQYALEQGVVNNAQVGGATSAAAAATRAQTWKPATQQQSFLGMPGGSAAAAFVAPVNQTAQAYDQAAGKAQMLARTERERLGDQLKNNRAALAEHRIRTGIEDKVTGASLGMASMGLAMGAMMVVNNDFVNSLGKWLMIGTLVVPAVKVVATATSAAAKSAWTMAAGNIAAARAAKANAIALGAAAGKFGTLRAGVTGLVSGIAGAIGPGGLVTLGVLAVGGAYYWAWNKGKEAREAAAEAYRQQVALSKRVESSTRTWAEQMGKVVGQYERVSEISGDIIAGRAATPDALTEQDQLIDYYKKNPEGDAKSPVDEFKELYGDEGATFDMAIVQKFIDLQVEAELTAKEAAAHIRAFFIAMGDSADTADMKAQQLIDNWGKVDSKNFDWAGYLKQQMDLFNSADDSAAGAAGKNASEAFWAGMVNRRNPEQAKQLLDQYLSGSKTSIEEAFDEIGAKYGPSGWYNWLADNNIQGVEDFAKLLRSTSMEELRGMDWRKKSESAANPNGYSLPYTEILMILEDANNEQDRLLTGLNGILQFGPDVESVFDLPDYSRVIALTTTYKEQKAIVEDINASLTNQAGAMVAQASAQDLATINAFNMANGLKTSTDYAKALEYFMNRTKSEAGNAADEADNVGKNVKAIPTMKDVTIRVKQVGDVVQTAMGNVQQRMADSAMTQFNERWDSTMASAQDTWDARQDGLQASHEASMSKLERGQEAAQEAFDRRWEKRREAIEKEYEKKIKRVNREIEAEKKADEVRQRLFEKEKQRLSRLAELQNTDIDFNTALNEGRLDDAAKIANNAGAEAGNAQMDAEAKAAEARTEARIKALEKKNERLEKARDKELKNLEKLEERMRKHLERVQDARRKALEKQQSDEVKALEKSETAAMKSLDKQREYEEATLQQRLDLFLAYTARNKKDLERWMRELGFEYDDFGDNVEKKGESWAKTMRKSLLDEIREAGIKVKNDTMWEQIGETMGKKLIKGLGFDNMRAFNKFVNTGKMPKDGKGGKTGATPDVAVHHGGGVIGQGGGTGRGNIPNTYKGMHRSERMVLAQKGEYVINKKAVKDNLGLLEAINKGSDVSIPGTGGIGEGIASGLMGQNSGYGGPAGLMAGAVSNMFKAGVEKGFQNAYQKGLAKQKALQSVSGKFAGQPGVYGGRKFSAEQMKNAAIIASVGSSMGMSKRDIQIGIMTAIAESGLVNVNHGHLDSLGLFQQRPSMGWGTAAQVTNPQYASRAFFGPLKAHAERVDESPWLAAQHIQRSAFSDGSNYRVWWEAAQQIFNSGLTKAKGKGKNGGYVPGKGGKHRPISGPVTNGLHGGSTSGNPPAVDMAGPSGRPVYAVADGVVTSSRDIAGPLPTDRYRGDGPYGSFGRVVQMQTDSGAGILYAHLSRRSVSNGQRVKGGAVLGYSGNTGNSSGAHLHFGATNGPYAWLRKGGEIKYDNTHVVAHRGETMLSAPVTRQLKENIASGGGSDYNVTIDLRGAYIKEDVDIEKAVNVAIDKRENKLGRKRVVR